MTKALTPSARGELEITDLNIAYLNKDQLKVEKLGRGIAWLDTGTHQSLLEASHFIGTIESRQGLKIACLEEIALRKGFVSAGEFLNLVEELPKSSYREYLTMVSKEFV
jgi:glucose-1-phosphate thymidylyltransferase